MAVEECEAGVIRVLWLTIRCRRACGRKQQQGTAGRWSPYFLARHAKRDPFRLISFAFNGNSPGYGNFVFTLKRSAADFRRGARFGLIGKGAALCDGASTEFVVISVGGPGSDRRWPRCR